MPAKIGWWKPGAVHWDLEACSTVSRTLATILCEKWYGKQSLVEKDVPRGSQCPPWLSHLHPCDSCCWPCLGHICELTLGYLLSCVPSLGADPCEQLGMKLYPMFPGVPLQFHWPGLRGLNFICSEIKGNALSWQVSGNPHWPPSLQETLEESFYTWGLIRNTCLRGLPGPALV